MADASSVPIWVPILTTAIGGAIGVLGAIIGPAVLHGRQSKEAHKRRRGEKFEELIETLYEHKHWLEVQVRIRLYGEKAEKTISPIFKAFAIMAIYFPSFDDDLRNLDNKADRYELWMMKVQQKKNLDPKYDPDIGSEFDDYVSAFHALQKKLREYAGSEFQ